MLPLHYLPLIKQYRWGGTRLGTRLGKPIGQATDAAESWEVVDHGNDQSLVSSPDHHGLTLHELVRDHSRELFGTQSFEQFPLLLKFLDAHDRLSLQVHPNDEQAGHYIAGENGKTEAWVILDVLPDSQLWLGLKPGVDRPQLERALLEHTLDDVLHVCYPRPGDCYFVPAGTVHAIGEGILLAEVQQSSDLTFRLHDWGRLGADGRPRPIHIQESLDCTDFNRGPVSAIVPVSIASHTHAVEQLIDSAWFGIRRHRAERPVTEQPRDEFRILMLLDGEIAYADDAGQREAALRAGESLLIPASCPQLTLTPAATATWLEVTGPKR